MLDEKSKDLADARELMHKDFSDEKKVMKLKFKAKMEKHKKFIDNVQKDLEEELIRRNREKTNMNIEIGNINAKVKKVETQMQEYHQGMQNLGEVVACLVENSQIQ